MNIIQVAQTHSQTHSQISICYLVQLIQFFTGSENIKYKIQVMRLFLKILQAQNLLELFLSRALPVLLIRTKCDVIYSTSPLLFRWRKKKHPDLVWNVWNENKGSCSLARWVSEQEFSGCWTFHRLIWILSALGAKVPIFCDILAWWVTVEWHVPELMRFIQKGQSADRMAFIPLIDWSFSGQNSGLSPQAKQGDKNPTSPLKNHY